MGISNIAVDVTKGPLAHLADRLAQEADHVEQWLGIKTSSAGDKWVGSAAKTGDRVASEAVAHPFPPRSFIQKAEYGLARAMSWIGDRLPKPFKDLGYAFLRLIQPVKDTAVISNLGKLDSHLFRGEQLGPKGFATLKKMGIDTVINLEPESHTDVQYAQQVAMKVVEIPEPPIGEPTMAQGAKFLSTVTDPANGKVYFHCYHGSDRTGAMAAIYRVLDQGWSVNKALAEMPKYHFHAGFEDAKVKFVYDFLDYFKALPKSAQNAMLHKAPAAAG